LWRFHVRGSEYELGSVAFFDAGRVWADLHAVPELDGTGLGLKYGTGIGLRLHKGKTFVLRADVAWSPDARPLGFYFLAGQMF
jgi:hemolysin activation/secretion protein